MYDERLIKDHYAKVAEKHKASSDSTMEDHVIRSKEMAFIKAAISKSQSHSVSEMNVLEIGLGNGYVLESMVTEMPSLNFSGIEYTQELLEIAKDRKLENVNLQEGDARNLPYADDSFDVVYTERCLINILDSNDQYRALEEILRVLKPGGVYVMIECFTDGYENYNRARTECGLGRIPVAHHNLYFHKAQFDEFCKGRFDVVDSFEYEGEVYSANFLSTHFFMSRVLHPLVTQGDKVKNTEFVKFFSYMPSVGNYAPIQGYLLIKK